MYDILQLNDKLVTELKEIAQNIGIKGYNKMLKQDLIYKILDEQALSEKNSSNKDVPVVDEPNPQTGRRPRKPASKGTDKQEKAAEPEKVPQTVNRAIQAVIPAARKDQTIQVPEIKTQAVTTKIANAITAHSNNKIANVLAHRKNPHRIRKAAEKTGTIGAITATAIAGKIAEIAIETETDHSKNPEARGFMTRKLPNSAIWKKRNTHHKHPWTMMTKW